MKKVLVIVLAATVVLAFGAAAVAQVQAYDFEKYKTPGVYTDSPYCRVLRTDPFEYDCNDPPAVTYINYASVAQWIHVKSSSTRMDWLVLKPGNYFTNSIDLEFNSNGDVTIKLSGFDHLKNDDTPADVIEKYYWLGTGPPPTDLLTYWTPAPAMNGDHFIPEDEDHVMCELTLWEKIHVELCDSACEYKNVGTITFVLEEQKKWVTEMM